MNIEQLNINQIAELAHETNRAYCVGIGDDSQPTWDYAPDWQRKSAMRGVKFHLEQLQSGELPNPANSHNDWLEEKRADGWVYGPVKDERKKEHPCYVPYTELPVEQKMKDYLFGAVVKAFVDCVRDEEIG